jgi:hypothetical protein
MLQPLRLAGLTSLVLFLTWFIPADGKAADGVQITDAEGKLKIEINGKLFTEYHYKGAPHLYYHPVLGPKGLPMTRNFPMQKGVADEPTDHPHQRSLWFSHGDVNGIDFWAEGAKSGSIVHDKFLEITSGKESGVVRSANKWVAPDGTLVCTDERVFRVYNRPDTERLFDFEITIKASEKDLVLGDTKEGSFGVRLAPTIQLKGTVGKGHIVQSTGVKDDATWGKRADWCDYYGPVQDQTVGVAIFDHPTNPRHPTWWHVRDYGLFAANPFGVHDFENKEKGAGDLKIKGGQSVTFRYRVYLHEGDSERAKVAGRYGEYTK